MANEETNTAETKVEQAAAATQEAQGAAGQLSEQLNQAEAALNKANGENNASNEDINELRATVERLKADNRKLKDESAERRVTAKETAEKNEKLRKVAQVLGLEKADDDPEQLLKAAQEQAEENKREANELREKLNRLEEGDKLRHLARKAGADPEVLIPYLRGSGALPKWGSDDYEAQAAQVVKDTMERFPSFVAGGFPRSSGQTPTPPNSNAGETLTAEDIQRLVEQGDYETVNKAVAENRVQL